MSKIEGLLFTLKNIINTKSDTILDLKSITDKPIEDFINYSEIKTYKKKEIISDIGSIANKFFIILDGVVSQHYNDVNLNNDIIVQFLKAGDLRFCA